MANAKTVTTPISAAGRVWLPGEPVTSARALRRISDDKLVEMDPKDADEAQTEADGAEWYKHQTVKSVLECVGDDIVRAQYAYNRELARPELRQRTSVLGPLAAMLDVDDPEPDESDDDSDDEG